MLVALPVAVAVAAHASRGEAASVSAPPACEIAEPGDMDGRWGDAVHALKAWMEGPSGHDRDCSRVELRRDGARAWVIFTTADGRQAERLVGRADELLSVVEALTFTLPRPPKADSPATAPAASTAAPAPHPQLATPPRATPASPRASPAAEKGAWPGGLALPGVLFDARTGVRLPGPASCGTSTSSTCAFALLSIGVGVGVNVGRWELGVAASYEPAHATLNGGSLGGLTMSSYSAVLSVARHAALGDVDLAFGATTGLQLTHESNENAGDNQDGDQGTQGTIDQAEPRAGVFAGLVLPRHARLRVRPQLAFDVIPSHLGTSWSPGGLSLPSLAWWSASASLGVQWEAP